MRHTSDCQSFAVDPLTQLLTNPRPELFDRANKLSELRSREDPDHEFMDIVNGIVKMEREEENLTRLGQPWASAEASRYFTNLNAHKEDGDSL